MMLCMEIHSISQYHPHLPIEPAKMHKALSRMIAPSNANTAVFVLVSDDQRVRGILIAISEFYWWNGWKYATDVMTYAAKDAKGHGIKLYRTFLSWAQRMPKVVEVVTTISSDIVPVSLVERLLVHLGFERNGNTFSKYFYDKVRAAAPRKVS